MRLELPIAEYEFTYQAVDSVFFPDFSGSLWHSVLGKALRELSCLTLANDCENCLYASRCDYSGLFHSVNLPQGHSQSQVINTGNNIPSPHIIHISRVQRHIVKAGQNFAVKIFLAGNASQYLETLVRAMYIAGKSGFGENRSKAALIRVTEIKEAAGAKADKKVIFDQHTPLIISSETGKQALKTIPASPDQITLKLYTPYKPTGKSARQANFEADRFIMSIIRRISLMQYFSTGKQLKADYQKLKQLTQTVPVQSNLQWQKNSHHSRNKYNFKHGWTGELNIKLQQHEPLWQFLYLGQWLHAGKNASMGFGQYQLI